MSFGWLRVCGYKFDSTSRPVRDDLSTPIALTVSGYDDIEEPRHWASNWQYIFLIIKLLQIWLVSDICISNAHLEFSYQSWYTPSQKYHQDPRIVINTQIQGHSGFRHKSPSQKHLRAWMQFLRNFTRYLACGLCYYTQQKYHYTATEKAEIAQQDEDYESLQSFATVASEWRRKNE